MTIIGIDPGLTGGIAIIQDNAPVWVRPMPTLPSPKGKGRVLDRSMIVNLIRDELDNRPRVYIERQQPMPKQGIVSTGVTMEGYGWLQGMCEALLIPLNIVPAKHWQREMLNGVSTGDTKAASIVQAGRLFPGVNLRPTERSKPSHGMSDALLIAEYGRRQG